MSLQFNNIEIFTYINPPETQLVYISASFINSYGILPLSTTSETQRCPEGFKSLIISAKALFLSGTRFNTQLETITSKILSGKGISSISPFTDSLIFSLSDFIAEVLIVQNT